MQRSILLLGLLVFSLLTSMVNADCVKCVIAGSPTVKWADTTNFQ